MLLSVRTGSLLWLAILAVAIVSAFFASSPRASSAANPTVDSVRVGVSSNGPNIAPLTLVAGSTKTYYINGTVSDLDGYATIMFVTAQLYRSGVGSACTDDNNNCYSGGSCNLSNGSGSSIDYSCQINLQYYTDYTDSGAYESETWKAKVSVFDGTTITTSTDYDNEVSSLVSVNIPGSIEYGYLTLGSTSTSVPLTLTNYGNHAADVQIYSTANMNCSTGFIPISSQKWDLFDIDYASMSHTLSATPTTAGVSLPQQTNDFAAITDELYFRLSVPSLAVGGTCTGTTYIDAVSS